MCCSGRQLQQRRQLLSCVKRQYWSGLSHRYYLNRLIFLTTILLVLCHCSSESHCRTTFYGKNLSNGELFLAGGILGLRNRSISTFYATISNVMCLNLSSNPTWVTSFSTSGIPLKSFARISILRTKNFAKTVFAKTPLSLLLRIQIVQHIFIFDQSHRPPPTDPKPCIQCYYLGFQTFTRTPYAQHQANLPHIRALTITK